MNPEDLKPNEVFVFGSNTRGVHGAGAARTARNVFGAEDGIGEGPTGRCYAIPTRQFGTGVFQNGRLKSRSLLFIRQSVEKFIQHATKHPDLDFLVTPIGCGYAGYKPKDIAPMFAGAPSNVILPEEFKCDC